jgi:hypothetical protein
VMSNLRKKKGELSRNSLKQVQFWSASPK